MKKASYDGKVIYSLDRRRFSKTLDDHRWFLLTSLPEDYRPYRRIEDPWRSREIRMFTEAVSEKNDVPSTVYSFTLSSVVIWVINWRLSQKLPRQMALSVDNRFRENVVIADQSFAGSKELMRWALEEIVSLMIVHVKDLEIDP